MKKRITALLLLGFFCLAALAGCSGPKNQQVVFYSNADDEAVSSMKATLDAGGYAGQYIFQSFGTSELGGKMLAEGTSIEADVLSMSSYYLDSCQQDQSMFQKLSFAPNTLDPYPDFYAPFLGNQGAIFLNTEALKSAGLPAPSSLKDLADPKYAGEISVADIKGSSTAWLMVQALVSEYGEEGAKPILSAIYENAGVHLEQSGSAPIKKVRAGEVAIGFGLRHQAVADKAAGLPIDYIDPTEGNFTLTESLAVVDKGEKTNPLAAEMLQYIIENGRPALMEYYPVPLYQGESADAASLSEKSKRFPEALTVALLQAHQALSESCK